MRTASRALLSPALAWLALDDVGRLWVEVITSEGPRYDIFGADGVLLATVTGLPSAGFIDPIIVDGRIALVVPDSNGVHRVQVYRIKPGH